MLADASMRHAWKCLGLIMGLSCASRTGGAPPEVVDPGHGILRVLVVEQENGRPIPGVSVNLQVAARGEELLEREFAVAWELERRSVPTDADGAAEFILRLQRDYYVDGVVPELGDAMFSGTVSAPAGGSTREVRIEVPTRIDRVVRGRVTSLRGAAPLSAALVSRVSERVQSTQTVGRLRRSRVASVQTDSDGRFELRVPSMNSSSLTVEAADHAPARVIVLPPVEALLAHNRGELGVTQRPSLQAPDLDVDVVLEPCSYIPVRVLDGAGRPQPGVEVAVHSNENAPGWSWRGDEMSHVEPDRSFVGVTDDSGACAVPARLLAFFARIDLARDGAWLASESIVSALGREPVEELTLRVGSPKTIRGRALTPDGRPVAGTELWLAEAWTNSRTRFNNSDRPLARAMTDVDGGFSFTIDRAPQSESDWVVGPAYRRVDTLRHDPLAVAPMSVRVPRGANGELLPVEVTIWRGHYIGGRAQDENGRATAKRSLCLRAADHSVAHHATVMNDGSFLFGPLVPGDYSIECWGDREWADLRATPASTGDLDLQLGFVRAAGLQVAILDAAGVLRTDVQVELRPHEQPSAFDAALTPAYRDPAHFIWEDRRLRFLGLATGSFDLLVHCRSEETVAAATLDLQAGNAQELVLMLQPAANLRILNSRRGPPVKFALRVDEGMIERFDLASGARTERSLPAGKITLLVDGEESFQQLWTLTPGQRVEFQVP